MARRSGRKADLRWTGTIGGNAFFGAQSAGTAAVTIFSAAQTLQQTLMRIRGEVLVWKDGTSAPGIGITVGLGIILAQSGQSTTVFSSPLTDPEAPWIWWNAVTIGYEEMVTDVVDVPVLSGARIEVDSKAMRRVRPDVELQFVVENTTVLSAGSVNIAGNFRMLFGD